MVYRMLSILAVVTALALVASVSAAGQTPPSAKAAYTPPRTPDGRPDLQGIWNNSTMTPLERPAEFAGKEFFTPEEVVAYEKQVLQQSNADRRDGGADADVGRAYNEFWRDRGPVVATRRTSLVIDPPDGRIPPLTPEAQKRNAARAQYRKLHPADGPDDRPLAERCLLWNSAGPPMLPVGYNSNYQIIQSPGYVVIHIEMIHDARIIPVDGRPHLPSGVRQWLGDSRGRWEGNTLVVETTNFTDKTAFRGASGKMRLTERFTRAAQNMLLYEFTVEDEASFTKPWTAQIPMMKTEGPLFEYACHEGNYGLTNVLAGTRAEEKASAQAARPDEE
ncbi:MAG: hypothetical protein HYU27_05200 [Acidobacteria bacterium]|nr:hypothetical protein [Acidobacteriota bacterium]